MSKITFFDFQQGLCWLSRATGVIVRDIIFVEYVPHYKILTGNIFGLILKNKMAAICIYSLVMKSAYISLIIGCRGLVCETNV